MSAIQLRCLAAAVLAAATLLTTATPTTAADKANPVEGGNSFNNASAVEAGTLTGRVVLGNLYFYKVRLRAGQSLTVTATTTLPARYDPGNATEHLGVQIFDALRNPDRCEQDRQTVAIWRGGSNARRGGDVTADCSAGTIDDGDDPTELGGTYYIQAGLQTTNSSSRGTTLPLRLNIEIGTGVAPDPGETFDPGKPKAPIHTAAPQSPAPTKDAASKDTPRTANTAATSDTTDWAILAAVALVPALVTWIFLQALRRPRRITAADHAPHPAVPPSDGPPTSDPPSQPPNP